MIYIEKLNFQMLDDNDNIVYPDVIFDNLALTEIKAKDITMLYGNNGSGKSTILNVIGELIGAQRKKQLFKNKILIDASTSYYVPFDKFVRSSTYEMNNIDGKHPVDMPLVKRLITSDDIFNSINDRIVWNNKAVEEKIDARKEINSLRREAANGHNFAGMHEYDYFKKIMDSNRTTLNAYEKAHSRTAKEMQSNGETALTYFSEMIEPNGIYLLDEPENCLSPIYQIELTKIIKEASKELGCQFFIATHSPLILSMEDAVIYNLDKCPAKIQKWEELDNVILYFEFFMHHSGKFL